MKKPGEAFREDKQLVKDIMQCLCRQCDSRHFGLETALSELDLDSLKLMESLFELENLYGKALSNSELAALKTVEDIVKAFSSPTTQL